jgi:hypothetical protein
MLSAMGKASDVNMNQNAVDGCGDDIAAGKGFLVRVVAKERAVRKGTRRLGSNLLGRLER